jgi:Ca-activated chloride channel family protein
MSFVWPTLLFSLLLVPVLLYFYFRVLRRKKDLAAKFGALGVIRDARGRGPGTYQHIPPMMFLGGIAILLVSTARPQATVSVPRLEGTVILTFDVSGSMAADDLKPTRMEVAKAAATQFVKNQPPTVSIGVVVFSDGGISVQPPTDSRQETLATIERLVPRRSTSIANGILVALNTIVVDAGDPAILNSDPSEPTEAIEPIQGVQGWYPSAVIVLFTDGENTAPPDPVGAADLAAEMGVRLYTVGVGTPAGATIETEGFTVHTRLDEATLQFLADSTGGAYYNAGNEEDLRRIYDDLRPQIAVKNEEMEITSFFAGAGMLVFLIGGLLSLFWFGRVP